jgi:hypothetical protein
MAKIVNTGGYPINGNTSSSAITSQDSHPTDHAKPHLGGGGT